VICLGGQISNFLSNHIFWFSENIYLASFAKSEIYLSHPVPLRGALASVTNAGRGAVDAAASGVTRDGRAGFGA
jgi:hypothetical protein